MEGSSTILSSDHAPNSSGKLNLRRESFPWKRISLLASGIVVVLLLSAFGVLPVGSKDDTLSKDKIVGTDLALQQGLSEQKNKVKPENRVKSSYPSMTRYQISSVTPQRNRQIIRNQSDETLNFVNHTVRKGENIWKIARRYGLRTHTVVSSNLQKLSQHDYLPVGLTIRIPNRNGIYTKLKRSQTLWDLMQTYGTKHEAVLAFNEIESPSELQKGQKIFIPGARPVNPYKYQLFQGGDRKFSWPVSPGRRRVSSGFGERDHPILDRTIPHRGIDIAAKYGTAIFAARAGIVEFAGRRGGYGHMIKIRHGQNYHTVYSHMSKGFVQKGQYVQRGQRIGEIGESGLATGPNLHFEINKRDKAVDPLEYLTR